MPQITYFVYLSTTSPSPTWNFLLKNWTFEINKFTKTTDGNIHYMNFKSQSVRFNLAQLIGLCDLIRSVSPLSTKPDCHRKAISSDLDNFVWLIKYTFEKLFLATLQKYNDTKSCGNFKKLRKKYVRDVCWGIILLHYHKSKRFFRYWSGYPLNLNVFLDTEVVIPSTPLLSFQSSFLNFAFFGLCSTANGQGIG